MIPFIDIKAQQALIKDKVEANIRRVLEHGQFIMGPEIAECEQRLAELAGTDHCLTVSSGTDALLVPLMALGVGPGDAVFVPAFTFTATVEVVLLLGARPVYIDVDAQTFNIDPAHLEAQILAVRAEGRVRPRVVISVDLFGLPADYARLNGICQDAGLTLIADAAQSFGGAIGNTRVGRLAPITATSFFPAKPLGCYGDGGAVFTSDDELHKVMASIRVHGQGNSKYELDRVGLNARFDTLQAAVLLAKLDIFEDELAKRQVVAERYTAALDDAVATPVVPDNHRSAWAQYTIQSDRRDAVAAALRNAGIPSAIYYPVPMHLQKVYRDYGDGEGSCPVAETLAKRVLSLPMHPYVDATTVECVAAAVRSAVGAAGAHAAG